MNQPAEPDPTGSATADSPGAVPEADEPEKPPRSADKTDRDSGNGLVLQVIGNTSLLAAVLIYMGWNYENSKLSYFSVTAFSVNIGTVEYALRGLFPLFESGVIFFAVLMVAVIVIASKLKPLVERGINHMPKVFRGVVGRGSEPTDWIVILGLLVTAVALPLTWLNVSRGTFDSWFSHHRDVLYFVLALLASGQLLSTLPLRPTPGT